MEPNYIIPWSFFCTVDDVIYYCTAIDEIPYKTYDLIFPQLKKIYKVGSGSKDNRVIIAIIGEDKNYQLYKTN